MTDYDNQTLGRTPDFLKEKRIFDRVSSRFPVKFKDTRQDFGANVFLKDLSAEGAKITTKERVYLNDSVNLEVELLDGKGPMFLRGEVIWTKNQSEELMDAGIRFHKIVFMDLWRLYKSAETATRN